MQKKTIDKTIRKEVNKWLKSLPQKLADKVKPNVLVSGGSIASLFLREPVNDFDIYLQDIDVLLELADYYCRPLGISILDGRKKDIYLEELEEEKGFNTEIDLSEYAVYLKSLAPDQVSLEVGDGGKRYELSEKDLTDKEVFKPVFISPNAISLTNNIQIVTRFTGNHEEIHKNFDYIHATNYWTWNEGLVTNIKALESLLTKQLYYQGSLYPLTSVIRMKKFLLRGWKITAGEILKMLYQTSKLDLDDPIVLKEQLIGIDIAYFNILIKKLNGLKENETIANNIIGFIDEIFNEIDLGENIED